MIPTSGGRVGAPDYPLIRRTPQVVRFFRDTLVSEPGRPRETTLSQLSPEIISGTIWYVMPRFVLAIVSLAALGLVGAHYLAGGKEPQVNYRFEKVETGPLVNTVSASGTVRPVQSVAVTSQTAGQVTEVLVDFDSAVKAGQVLARLDPAVVAARLDQAQADLNVARSAVEIARGQLKRADSGIENAHASQLSAQADVQHAELTLVDAERDYKRKRELSVTGDAAKADTERAKTADDVANAALTAAKAHASAADAGAAAAEADAEVARAQLSNALATVVAREAAIHQVQLDLDHTLIRSPIDGIVIDRNIVVGETVGASTQGPALFTIAKDLRQVQLHANVDEADIGRVAINQAASFAFDSFPGQTFSGEVVAIRTMPELEQTIVTYEVVISADNAERQLLPGMTANVRIVVSQRDNVLKVPNAALRFRPVDPGSGSAATAPASAEEGSGAEVWRLGADGRPHAFPIRTGISDGVYTEVLAGELAAGQEVIVGLAEPSSKQPHIGPLRF
jgi:HlyD family secretion protein